MTILKSLLTGFAFILFSSVLLAVYVYTPETYSTLATDAKTVTTHVSDVIDEHIPEKLVTLEDSLLQAVPTDSESLSLVSILTATTSYHCIVSSDDNKKQQGTVLVGDGKVRAVFNREIGNRTTETHVIKNTDGIYVWNEGLDGLYFKTIEDSDILSDTHELSYTCSPQTLSSESFMLPENIKFYTR